MPIPQPKLINIFAVKGFAGWILFIADRDFFNHRNGTFHHILFFDAGFL